uniref:Uncharacterized protein n=1 Tax=Sphaerodactylus townsendi TaxID=933632 RepID=A0ACB8EF23_9SAUR
MNFEAVLHYKHQNQARRTREEEAAPASAGQRLAPTYRGQRLAGGEERDARTALSVYLPMQKKVTEGNLSRALLMYSPTVQGFFRVKAIQIDLPGYRCFLSSLLKSILTRSLKWVELNIYQLLTDIGRYHPQALIYPLTVASKSTTTARHNAANKILKNMCEHSNTLVQQAMMVAEECADPCGHPLYADV